MTNDTRPLARKIKDVISGIGWILFIEFSELTKEEYLNSIYEQEKNLRE